MDVPGAAAESRPRLAAVGLGFDFPTSRDVLAGVDLEIQAGERVALMGASGSGKSTLLHVLSGVLTPGRGRVEIDGESFSELSSDRRAGVRLRQFGFVFQFAELLPDLTIKENVELPLWLLGEPTQHRAEQLLDALGIGQVADHLPSRVSGGERQRAAIARAMAHRPRVVFADEPTGALDESTGASVMSALLSMASADGASVLVVTHNPAVAAQLDSTLTIRDGRIAG